MAVRVVMLWAVVLALASCGRAQHSEPASANFEAARMEAAQLISGRVRDWRTASAEGKQAYAMATVGTLSPAAARDPGAVRVFVGCVDNLAESSASHEPLSDLAFHCRQAL